MSQPAVSLDDIGYQDLRIVADRLLETTRVEYVDEGVLLVMNPPAIEHRRIVRAIVEDAKRAFYTGAVTVNWAPPITWPPSNWKAAMPARPRQGGWRARLMERLPGRSGRCADPPVRAPRPCHVIMADRRVVDGHPSRGQCRRPVREAIPTGQVQQGETGRMSEDLEDSLQDRVTS